MPNSPHFSTQNHSQAIFPLKLFRDFYFRFNSRRHVSGIQISDCPGSFPPKEGITACINFYSILVFLSGKSYKKSREQHKKKTRLKHPPRKSNRRGWEFYDRKGFSGPEHFPRFGLVALNLLFFSLPQTWCD